MNRIKIQGMTCEHCAKAVIQALSEVEGITNVRVSLENNEALFESSDQVDMEKVHKAIDEAGYKVIGTQNA